ncbi:hypothetical protein Tco_0015494 [Tanacetum coccineum]
MKKKRLHLQRDMTAQEKASNATLTAEFDDVQARMDADALILHNANGALIVYMDFSVHEVKSIIKPVFFQDIDILLKLIVYHDCPLPIVSRALRNQGNKKRDAPRRNAPVDTSTTNALVVQDGIVPPPYTGNYMPSRPDLSFVGLDESVFKSAMRKTTTGVPETKTSISKTSKDIIEKPKTVRPSAPIIEEWDTDNDNDSVFRPKSDQTKPKFTKINFVKSGENVKSVNKKNTHRLVEYPRKTCFVCGSFNHLIKDCDFHDNKMVEKPVLNNKGRVTGQREIKPVWNIAQRVNHQNKLTHSHPKSNFVPTTVATKSGQVLVNAAKQSSLRAATSISTARPVNTAAPKPKVNDALPTPYSYFQAHSLVKKSINKRTAVTDINFNKKINTTKANNVTIAGPKAVVSAAEGNGENVVKSSACWIWRPTVNVINHISKDSGSYMLKRFDYVDLQGRLKSAMAWIPKRN